MNILITNDDGINSQGILALAKEFINEGSVIISAPDRQRSASSHSITMHKPISARKSSFHGLNCNAYAVTGTPVDCVKLAYEKLANSRIDMVISGINEGSNLGTDVIYSGTVSAAIEGALLNIPSLAISLAGVNSEMNYNTAAQFTHMIFNKFIKDESKEGIVLNINIPNCKRNEVKGIIASSIGSRKYINNYEERKDQHGNLYYCLTGEIDKVENGSTTDIYAAENNYISITPMRFEFTRYDYLDNIGRWEINL
jgi:5'-nucleotidase